jgi:hypothetical protein
VAHGRFRQAGVSAFDLAFRQKTFLALAQRRKKTPVRRLAQNQVARLVVASHRQHVDDIVVRPFLRIARYSQVQRMRLGKMAANEPLRAHVQQRIGQAVEPAVRHVLVTRPGKPFRGIQPRPLGIKQRQPPQLVSAPRLVNTVERDGTGIAAQFPAQGIAGAAGAAAADHRIPQGLQRTRQRRAINATQPRTQIRAPRAWKCAERLEQIGGSQLGHQKE